MSKFYWVLGVLIAVLCMWIALRSEDDVDFGVVSGLDVLVTGASGGIGEELAYIYARHGANVVVTARREQRLKQVVEKCKSLSPSGGGSFHYIVADMADEGQTQAVVKTAMKHLSKLDHLVLNHGRSNVDEINFYSGSQLDRDNLNSLTAVNYLSHVTLASEALPYLKVTNGSIAVSGSAFGRIPTPLMASYSASKAALGAFFDAFGWELRMQNVNVSVTHAILGATDTDAQTNYYVAFGKRYKITDQMRSMRKSSTPARAAKHILAAILDRWPIMFHPSEQSFYFLSILRSISPALIEYIMSALVFVPV